MKIIIAGGGKVGTEIAKLLSTEGHDITLIDTREGIVESNTERFDIMGIHGNAASVPVLDDAGVKTADLLIAVTNADELNLLCCMTAHVLNNKIHTIARIRNPEYYYQIYSMRDSFALSLTVNPELQAAHEIERLLKFPGFVQRDTFAKGRVEIVELKIGSDSKLVNVPLSGLYKIIRCKVLVCAVVRDSKAYTPTGDFVLQEGDRLFITSSTSHLAMLLNNLGIISKKVNRVLLCGGGRVSYYLAKVLEASNISISIIEQDYDRCTELSDLLPNASIIHGDASDQALLESEMAGGCDALISATGFDEMNMVISLYGNNRGVPQIITKIGRMDHSKIWDDLPLGSVICPKELCSHSIIRYIRAMQNGVEGAITMHTIADGLIEALEFLVDADTMHCGEPLKNIKLRKNVLVACITHGGKTEIPNGESTYRRGDTMVVVTNGSNVIHQLNDIFA